MPVRFIEPLTLEAFRTEGKIYRTLNIDRTFEMFENNKFTFLSPSKWKDPYEKGFLTLNISVNENPLIIPSVPHGVPLNYSLFSQCWSAKSESEAFWKVRSPLKDGINISVDTQRLFDYLNELPYDFYIGKVKYVLKGQLFDEDEIRGELNQAAGNNLLFHLRLLLRKRNTYSYEEEYRIFLHLNPSIANEYFDIMNFDPCDIIYRIMLHPEIGVSFEKVLKKYFKDKCGNAIRITKSKFEQPIRPVNIAL
jgi:hypothetical protein